jgi:RNA polymerase sigma factor (sigma-70 family)
MQQPYAQPQLTSDLLYRTYWERVVRFCNKHLATLPDGTAEEVAQDVFLVAHRALERQHYRGDSQISTWLFGIAYNLCGKARRDTYRRTTARSLRHLEHLIKQLEADVTRLMRDNSPAAQRRIHLIHERLTRTRAWLERERAQLQRHIMAGVHRQPEAPLDDQRLAPDPLGVLQDSLARFARCQRQMHTLLYMHVLKEKTVKEIAECQGVSRSAVYRGLARAKTELRRAYHSMTL